MKKHVGKAVFLLIVFTTVFCSLASAKAANLYTQEKLHTGWFNQLGGLDNIMTEYALLTIDESGGISIEDKFNVFSQYVKQHWVTIDSVGRGENKLWKDHVAIYATFHYFYENDEKEYHNQGNGIFKFPSSGVIHLLSGASPSVEITDHYAETHPNSTDQNDDQNNSQNNNQNNGHDPCDVSARTSREAFVNKTFLKFRKGMVRIKPKGCDHWVKTENNMDLKLGDIIRTGSNGRATIVLGGTSFVKVKPNSALIIPETNNMVEKVSFLKLLWGVLWAHAKKEKNSLKIATPHAVVGVRGTEFEISYQNDISCVKALKHSVWFSDQNKRKTVIVHEGEKSCIGKGGFPVVPTPIQPEVHSGSVAAAASSSTGSSQSTGVKKYRYTGYDPNGFISPSLLLEIYPSGKIEGMYTAKGRALPNNNCSVSSKRPLHGYLTHNIKPAAKGMLDRGVIWCDIKPSLKPKTHATPFSMWYERGKGLIMDMDNGHGGFKVFFNKPSINPFHASEESEPQQISVGSIAGTWHTNFGEMNLTQRGNIVTGRYTHDRGRIKGTLKGNIFIGKWSEAPTYKPDHDAGDVKFIFSKDGKSFSGQWRYGFSGNSWSGDWQGHRISPKEKQ